MRPGTIPSRSNPRAASCRSTPATATRLTLIYLIALNYYEQISDVTRDQSITRQALDALGELVRRYPDTRYAADARLKIDLVRDHLAGKEMEIGRFYQRRAPVARLGDPLPQRRRRISDDHPRARSADAAHRILSRARHPGGGARARPRCSAPIIRTPNGIERAYELVQKHAPAAARGRDVTRSRHPGEGRDLVTSSTVSGEAGSGTHRHSAGVTAEERPC